MHNTLKAARKEVLIMEIDDVKYDDAYDYLILAMEILNVMKRRTDDPNGDIEHWHEVIMNYLLLVKDKLGMNEYEDKF